MHWASRAPCGGTHPDFHTELLPTDIESGWPASKYLRKTLRACFHKGAALGAAQVDDGTVDVTELPVRKWTQDYKEYLESLIKPDEKVATQCSACLPLHALAVPLHRFPPLL